MEHIDKRLVKECQQYGVDINNVPMGPCSEIEALEMRLQILVLEKKLSASRTSRWNKALEVESLQKTVKDLEERERKLREEREVHMKELRRLYNGGGKPKGAKGSKGRRSRSRKETVTTSSGNTKPGASSKKRNRKRKPSPRPGDVKKKRGRPLGSTGNKSQVPGDLGQSVSVNVITVGNGDTGVTEGGLGPCSRPKRIRKPSPKMQDPFFEMSPVSPSTAASVTDGGDNVQSVKNQGKYPCDHCGRALSDKSRLIQHVARFHSGDGDSTDSAGEFKCEHCEKSYVERYRLQRHYRMSHQIDLK